MIRNGTGIGLAMTIVGGCVSGAVLWMLIKERSGQAIGSGEVAARVEGGRVSMFTPEDRRRILATAPSSVLARLLLDYRDLVSNNEKFYRAVAEVLEIRRSVDSSGSSPQD